MALLLLAAMCAVAVACTATRADEERRTFLAVALPQPDSRATWAEEREAFAARLAQAFHVEPSVADEFAAWILESSTRQALPPELLASLVMTESSFRKDVRSAMGAVGPGQVRPDLWGAWCGVNLAEPEENIDCAARILAHYVEVCAHRTTEAEACALRSYNVGYRNRNNRYFVAAADRYLAKIQRYLADFRST
ncbi:MAG: lytic transglycosylase domain-containing protein [Gammaproteobacteria bacterium]|nr:lytic transglycosylase domain-containing protein [Gammaproteobacteria bacterium]